MTLHLSENIAPNSSARWSVTGLAFHFAGLAMFGANSSARWSATGFTFHFAGPREGGALTFTLLGSLLFENAQQSLFLPCFILL